MAALEHFPVNHNCLGVRLTAFLRQSVGLVISLPGPRFAPPTDTKLKNSGYLAGAVDKVCSDDDLGIEDDDEFQKKKAVHDKKKRQAEKVLTLDIHHASESGGITVMKM